MDSTTWEEVAPALRGFAFRAVRRGDVADDLVQETYLAAWQGRHEFEGRSSIRTWMVGILSRKIVDHYRRNRREVPLDRVPEPHGTASPEGRLDALRGRALCERHLGRLPPLERRAILLCDFADVSREEAATDMEVTRGHLRVLLHRGRQRLRAALERELFSPTAPSSRK